jgi:hypothetical protein
MQRLRLAIMVDDVHTVDGERADGVLPQAMGGTRVEELGVLIPFFDCPEFPPFASRTPPFA